MKNIKKYLFTIILFIIFITNVSAATTKNGVKIAPNSDSNDKSVELTCKYKNSYEVGFSKINKDDDDGDFECNSMEECFGLGVLPNKRADFLKSQGFMYNDNTYDCPMYVYGNLSDTHEFMPTGFTNDENKTGASYSFFLDVSKSSCKGSCSGEQYSNDADHWTCDYKSDSGLSLQTKYDGKYKIIYPDKTSLEVDKNKIGSHCGDIFCYTESLEEDNFIMMNGNISNYKDLDNLKELYSLICSGDTLIATYFCSGNCKYPDNKNVSCKDLKEKINNMEKSSAPADIDLTEMCYDIGVKKGLKLVGSLILVAKIVIPILLIIMGSIDFGKAAITSDSDALSKATKKFATRIGAGVAVFLLPTIINFIFDFIPVSNSFDECQKCVMHPGLCDTNPSSN